MAFAIITDGVAVEIAEGDLVPMKMNGEGEIIANALYTTAQTWTESEAQGWGVWIIVEPIIPPGQQIASSTLVGTGPVSRNATFEDIPIPPVIVPIRAEPLPFRLALRSLGHYDAVKTWAYTAGNETTADAWEAANMIERTSQFVINGATALGLTTEQVDAVFLEAATIAPTL